MSCLICNCSRNTDWSGKVLQFPSQPNWFFVIMALVISMMVAGKSYAQSEGESVGRKAAKKYFTKEAKPEGADEETEDMTSSDRGPTGRFMVISVGTFFNDDAFSWGSTRNVEDAGDYGLGVTYRIGQWTSSMDWLFRAEWLTYELPEGDASKLSFNSMLQFPEASSGFPLFFGIGAGLGVFTKQISDESDVSFDYQLGGGARFFNLYKTVGVVAEVGLKNHLHLFSSGQFNSLFFSVGSVFTF